VSDLVATLRALVRHELTALRLPELAIVTEIFPRDGDGSDGNHQANVRLQASGVELQRAAVVVGRPGLTALPNPGDLVVVTFLGGDLNAPVVLGAVYDEQGRPPVAGPREVVYQPPDAEESGVRRLHLELPSGTAVTLDDDAVQVKSGGTEVTVERDGGVTVKAQGTIRLETQGDLELEAAGALRMSAQGEVEIQGATATVEGQGSAKLKAPSVSLAGNTQFSPS
jgi:uncharacterized protein involved in type VI secretion and phage assembly